MLMVDRDCCVVEVGLVAGWFCCPGCDGRLARWGFASRRVVRGVEGLLVWVRPRRGRCVLCGGTHVLLPVGCLVRRRDSAEVIVTGLVLYGQGLGVGSIAKRFGVPVSTVRGWVRRFRLHARGLMLLFRSWALLLDPGLDPPGPSGSEVGDALECLGLAARAVVWRFGPRPVSETVSRLTGGGLIFNTSSLWRLVR